MFPAPRDCRALGAGLASLGAVYDGHRGGGGCDDVRPGGRRGGSLEFHGRGRPASQPAHTHAATPQPRGRRAAVSRAGTGGLHPLAAPAGVGVRVASALRRARAPPHVSVRARLPPALHRLRAAARDRLVGLGARVPSGCLARSSCSRTATSRDGTCDAAARSGRRALLFLLVRSTSPGSRRQRGSRWPLVAASSPAARRRADIPRPTHVRRNKTLRGFVVMIPGGRRRASAGRRGPRSRDAAAAGLWPLTRPDTPRSAPGPGLGFMAGRAAELRSSSVSSTSRPGDDRAGRRPLAVRRRSSGFRRRHAPGGQPRRALPSTAWTLILGVGPVIHWASAC